MNINDVAPELQFDVRSKSSLQTMMVRDQSFYKVWAFRRALAAELEPMGLTEEDYTVDIQGSTRSEWRVVFENEEAWSVAFMLLG